MAKKWAGLGGLLLLLAGAAAFYWLFPAYLLPPSNISQRPPARVEKLEAAQPATSYVHIPLAFSVDNIKRLVRERLSDQLLVENLKVPGRDLKISIKRNGKLALWVLDNNLHMVLPIEFETEGDLNTDGEMTIFTRASFDVAENWEPMVHARSTFRWDSDPKVGFWPFRFNIASDLAPFVQLALDRGAEDFRVQATRSYNLHANAEAGWKRLHGPHAVDPVNKAWLTMQPREIYLESITSDQDELRMNAWMVGQVGIVHGEQPAPATPTPLPLLKRGAPPGKTAEFAAPLSISYERMLSSLNSALVGQTLPSSSGDLAVKALDLYGSGQNLALGIDFEGRRHNGVLPTRGRIYLTGEPYFDEATQTLRVRGLQITEPSLNPLSHGARWVLQDASSWSAGLEPRMHWSVASLLKEHHQKLDGYLNQTIHGRFDLWGKAKAIEVVAVRPDSDGVTLDTRAVGELELLFVP